MKRLEKLIVGIAIGVAMTVGAVNAKEYVNTVDRFMTPEQRYTAESESLARQELEELGWSPNPLKIGYRMGLKEYLRRCQEASNVGII